MPAQVILIYWFGVPVRFIYKRWQQLGLEKFYEILRMKALRFLMFNGFVRQYLHSNPWFLRWNKRVQSVGLEMWYTLSVFFPFLIVLTILPMAFNDPSMNFRWIHLISLVPFSLMMIALFNKDFFNGQSVVHRYLGYQVLDVKTKKPASKLKCMLRNVTAPVWPIEAIFILVYPNRRLGDFIAGTTLGTVAPVDPETVLDDIRVIKLDADAKMALGMSIICVLVFMILFDPRTRLW